MKDKHIRTRNKNQQARILLRKGHGPKHPNKIANENMLKAKPRKCMAIPKVITVELDSSFQSKNTFPPPIMISILPS